MPANVCYHIDFFTGSYRSDSFSDYPKLQTSPPALIDEADLLFDFITAVQDGDILCGKNKPSWTNTYGEEMLHLVGYKAYELWHYHVGPYTPSTSANINRKIREMNLEGLTSAAAVHYKWYNRFNKNKIVIIAFSPIHRPFPKMLDKPNHLNSRGGLIFNKQIVEHSDNKLQD
ncbi:hypothetical protein [Escherichia coli]|uniref:hypothetical protein n=1 Tax=Escherichia coli TaxID=562 RepID=UPI00197FC5ED|nr:hypothetical protein [Escherichia coli]EJQ5984506.1 hypothetical protein [Escherichia coli]HBV0219232.1 hypothetical protein [Escherichia coli]